MKKHFVIIFICILIIGGLSIVMINTKTEKELELKGWISWYSSLTPIEQESISYTPLEVKSILAITDNTKEYVSITELSKETREWLKWYSTLSSDEQSAISYVPFELQVELPKSEVYDATTNSVSPKIN